MDVIISVGCRVKSKHSAQFRIWAVGGYFNELLEWIRDIRVSEKVFYRQVLEIYATSAADKATNKYKNIKQKLLVMWNRIIWIQ